MSQPSVGFLTFDRDRSDKTGSARIRAGNLIKYWPESELFVTGRKYDAVIFQKYYWHDYAELYDGIKIADICDPDWLTGNNNVNLVRFLKAMDGVVANTEKTAEYLRKITDKPVVVIEDRHDIALMKGEKQHKGRAKSVFWFGYVHNADILSHYIPKLMEHNLKLTIISNEFKTLCSYQHTEFKKNEDFVKWTDNIEDINKEFLKHDFAVLPVSRRLSHQYKSNNKTTHCWALGIPVAAWGDDIDRLMNEDERNKDKAEHMAVTRKNYDSKQSVRQYKEFIDELKNNRKTTA